MMKTVISMELNLLFCEEIPAFLAQAAATPPMERLKAVGMNCGCEYTSFPRFAGCQPYSRYTHSLRVARIIWAFTQSPAQSLAGLFHDIATPTFSHVVDFLRGDHLHQEATEAGTEAIIAASAEIQSILRTLGLNTADVCDYHRYPVADNDAPQLSSDRLEYTLGNLVQFGFGTVDLAKSIFDAIVVGENENGEVELIFTAPETALTFAQCALACSSVYVSPEDRYAMQMLSELLHQALTAGVLTEADLMTTEPELLARLRADRVFDEKWKRYCAYHTIHEATAPVGPGEWRVIPAKKRCIDPYVQGRGRVSVLFPEFAEELAAFRAAPQNMYLMGE